jgi:ADP-ribose pyrophosphatase
VSEFAAPRIASRTIERLSPWVSVAARAVVSGNGEPQVFHSLQLHDYVSVIALTTDGQVPLVRQFRPALERFTLELPGGLLDGTGESASDAAVRELSEEIGREPLEAVQALGCLQTDTGRLENKICGYFARISDTDLPAWRPEPGVERQFVSLAELRALILNGTFDHALHVALISLASARGWLQWR